MRQGNARIGSCKVGFVLAALAFAGAAWAGEVRSLALEHGATGTRAEIDLHGAGQYKTLSLAGPDRLVLDLPDSHAARSLKLPAPTGVVAAVRTGQPVPGTLRIVFELSAPVNALPLRVEPSADGARLAIHWPGDGTVPAPMASALPQAAAVATTAEPVAPASASTASPLDILEGRTPGSGEGTVAAGTPATGLASAPVEAAPAPTLPPPAATPAPPSSRARATPAGTRVLVVAIDAGHGGQDPGAIGPTGKREKDVNLAMAREMARQINATAGLKAFLVRDADVFIPLPTRAQIARKAKADIFVSLHADAAENRNASGSSVYVLSTKGASSQRARWLADKENAADLVGGVRLQQTENVLAGVLLDLAQSGHMRASEDAANHVLGGLKRVGNNHKPNIERANFAVLRTSDMPAMLVETAFISNVEEEKRLVDPAYQRKVAGAVVDGISTYFTRQPPPGTLFAARAEAGSLAMAGAGGTP